MYSLFNILLDIYNTRLNRQIILNNPFNVKQIETYTKYNSYKHNIN